jgi:hypothetical protein
MKRKDLEVGMEVAIVRADYDYSNPTRAVVEDINPAMQVYHRGSFRSSTSQTPGVRVRILTREGRPGEHVEVLPLNQIKPIAEVRQVAEARAARRVNAESASQKSKNNAEAALAALAAAGIPAQIKYNRGYEPGYEYYTIEITQVTKVVEVLS